MTKPTKRERDLERENDGLRRQLATAKATIARVRVAAGGRSAAPKPANAVDPVDAWFGRDSSMPQNLSGCGICGQPVRGAAVSDQFLEHPRYHVGCWERAGQSLIPPGGCQKCHTPIDGPVSVRPEGLYHAACWGEIVAAKTKAA